MANTFTTNYNLIKSEIGGDNQSWGNNLHTTLDLTDLAIGKLLEDQIVSGVTSSAIDIRKDNATNTISTDADLKYFEAVVIGDKIRVSCTGDDANVANGTAAAPIIHTVTAKATANNITVSNNLIKDTTSTVTIAKVLEPVHINSGPIVCAPLTNLSEITRTAGGVGQPGTGSNKDVTDALKASGNVTLGSSASTDTVTITAKMTGDLTPSQDGSYDLGASGAEWEDLHIDGTANIDTLVADTAAISGGSITGGTGSFTTLAVTTGTTIAMNGYDIKTNGKGTRTVSGSGPSGTATNGDVWYEVA
jgi:hypothetical protein